MAMAKARAIAFESLLKGKGKAFVLEIQRNLSHHLQFPINCSSSLTAAQTHNQRRTNSYVSEMRKSAIDANMLRLVRNEIHYELHRSPLQKPPTEMNGLKVSERPGEQWISLEKQFGEKEEIKVEATMFDGFVPVPKEGEKSGLPGQELHLHISMIVTIFKTSSNQVLEFTCSAWPDTVEITNLFVRQRAKVPHHPYTGPKFRELDDELQDSLYQFLEQRGMLGKTNTLKNRQIRRPQISLNPQRCIMCFESLEDNDHLILQCKVARELWKRLFNIKGEKTDRTCKIRGFLSD